MKATRNKLYELHNSLKRCMDVKGEKFAYAIIKNKHKLESFLKHHEEEYAELPKFIEFQMKLREIVKENAKKKKDGTYEFEDTIESGKLEKKYVIKDQKKFDKEEAALKKEYKDVIKEREKQLEDFQKSLDDEVEFDAHVIDRSQVPSDITANQLEGVVELING